MVLLLDQGTSGYLLASGSTIPQVSGHVCAVWTVGRPSVGIDIAWRYSQVIQCILTTCCNPSRVADDDRQKYSRMLELGDDDKEPEDEAPSTGHGNLMAIFHEGALEAVTRTQWQDKLRRRK